jgi:hypothetical protein
VAGATVRPVGGRWTGGWGSELSRLRVQACRAREGRNCVTLSAEGVEYPGSHRTARVDRRYVGWYLFAYDQRLARDTVFGGPAYGRPSDVPPLGAGGTVVRSAALGPVSAG